MCLPIQTIQISIQCGGIQERRDFIVLTNTNNTNINTMWRDKRTQRFHCAYQYKQYKYQYNVEGYKNAEISLCLPIQTIQISIQCGGIKERRDFIVLTNTNNTNINTMWRDTRTQRYHCALSIQCARTQRFHCAYQYKQYKYQYNVEGYKNAEISLCLPIQTIQISIQCGGIQERRDFIVLTNTNNTNINTMWRDTRTQRFHCAYQYKQYKYQYNVEGYKNAEISLCLPIQTIQISIQCGGIQERRDFIVLTNTNNTNINTMWRDTRTQRFHCAYQYKQYKYQYNVEEYKNAEISLCLPIQTIQISIQCGGIQERRDFIVLTNTNNTNINTMWRDTRTQRFHCAYQYKQYKYQYNVEGYKNAEISLCLPIQTIQISIQCGGIQERRDFIVLTNTNNTNINTMWRDTRTQRFHCAYQYKQYKYQYNVEEYKNAEISLCLPIQTIQISIQCGGIQERRDFIVLTNTNNTNINTMWRNTRTQRFHCAYQYKQYKYQYNVEEYKNAEISLCLPIQTIQISIQCGGIQERRDFIVLTNTNNTNINTMWRDTRTQRFHCAYQYKQYKYQYNVEGYKNAEISLCLPIQTTQISIQCGGIQERRDFIVLTNTNNTNINTMWREYKNAEISLCLPIQTIQISIQCGGIQERRDFIVLTNTNNTNINTMWRDTRTQRFHCAYQYKQYKYQYNVEGYKNAEISLCLPIQTMQISIQCGGIQERRDFIVLTNTNNTNINTMWRNTRTQRFHCAYQYKQYKYQYNVEGYKNAEISLCLPIQTIQISIQCGGIQERRDFIVLTNTNNTNINTMWRNTRTQRFHCAYQYKLYKYQYNVEEYKNAEISLCLPIQTIQISIQCGGIQERRDFIVLTNTNNTNINTMWRNTRTQRFHCAYQYKQYKYQYNVEEYKNAEISLCLPIQTIQISIQCGGIQERRDFIVLTNTNNTNINTMWRNTRTQRFHCAYQYKQYKYQYNVEGYQNAEISLCLPIQTIQISIQCGGIQERRDFIVLTNTNNTNINTIWRDTRTQRFHCAYQYKQYKYQYNVEGYKNAEISLCLPIQTIQISIQCGGIQERRDFIVLTNTNNTNINTMWRNTRTQRFHCAYQYKQYKYQYNVEGYKNAEISLCLPIQTIQILIQCGGIQERRDFIVLANTNNTNINTMWRNTRTQRFHCAYQYKQYKYQYNVEEYKNAEISLCLPIQTIQISIQCGGIQERRDFIVLTNTNNTNINTMWRNTRTQ